ncbi:MAG: HEAT repeat domain-containing protein [Planctomycetes bacterium]|nr:HEAT repeat domain-containing protein [Planctomycetota bacterium]
MLNQENAPREKTRGVHPLHRWAAVAAVALAVPAVVLLVVRLNLWMMSLMNRRDLGELCNRNHELLNRADRGTLLACLEHADAGNRVKALEELRQSDSLSEANLPSLRRALADPDLPVRVAAGCALDSLGFMAGPAMPEAVLALRDPDPQVRFQASNLLSLLGAGAAEATPELVAVLRDRQAAGRVEAAHALRRVDGLPEQAAEDLLSALDPSEDPKFAEAVACLLVGSPHASPAVADRLRILCERWTGEERGSIAWALSVMAPGDPAVRRWLEEELSDPSIQKRSNAALCAVALGEDAAPLVPGLLRVVTDPNEEGGSRWSSPFSWTTTPIPGLLEGVLALARDPQHPGRAAALRHVGRFASATEEVRTLLADCIREPDAEIRRAAYRSLRDLGSEMASLRPLVVELLGKETDELTLAAGFEALGAFGPPEEEGLTEVLAVLASDLQSRGLSPETMPGASFTAWSSPGIPTAAARLRTARLYALAALAPKHELALPIARRELSEAESFPAGVVLLAEAGGSAEESANKIARLLFWGSDAEQECYVAAISRIDRKQGGSIPTLRKNLTQSAAVIGRQSAEALGSLGPAAASAVDVLIAALDAEAPTAAVAAADALGEIGSAARAAIPSLVRLRGCGVPRLVEAGLRALGHIGIAEPAVLDALEAALRDGPEEARAAAGDALTCLGPSATPIARSLVRLAEPRSPSVPRWGWIILVAAGERDPAAIPHLIRAVETGRSWEERTAAAAALAEMGPAAAAAAPALQRMLHWFVEGCGFCELRLSKPRSFPARMFSRIDDESPLEARFEITVPRGDPELLPALLDALEKVGGADLRSLSSAEAATRMQQVRDAQAGLLALGHAGPRARAFLPYLRRCSRRAIPPMNNGLQLWARWACSRIGDEAPGLGEELVRLVGAGRPATARAAAAGILGEMGLSPAGAVEAEVRALSDADPWVRLAAAGALGAAPRGTAPVLAALRTAAERELFAIRRAARASLARLGER